jgi:hypothetical protein
MVSSTTLTGSRAISSFRSSAGGLVSAAWPAAKKTSRQPEGGRGGDAEIASDEFQVFAAEEAEDRSGLATGGEAAALGGVRRVGHGFGSWVWT